MVWYLIWDYHTLSEVPPGRPLLDLKWVLLSMSAEQIVSKWSFRLVGNTLFGPSQMEVLRWCVVHMRDATPCTRGLPVGVYLISSHSGPIPQDGLKGSILGPVWTFLRIAKVV